MQKITEEGKSESSAPLLFQVWVARVYGYYQTVSASRKADAKGPWKPLREGGDGLSTCWQAYGVCTTYVVVDQLNAGPWQPGDPRYPSIHPWSSLIETEQSRTKKRYVQGNNCKARYFRFAAADCTRSRGPLPQHEQDLLVAFGLGIGVSLRRCKIASGTYEWCPPWDERWPYLPR